MQERRGMPAREKTIFYVVCSEDCLAQVEKSLRIIYARDLETNVYSILIGVSDYDAESKAYHEAQRRNCRDHGQRMAFGISPESHVQ